MPFPFKQLCPISRLSLALALVVLSLLLSACGQKGPLYMPNDRVSLRVQPMDEGQSFTLANGKAPWTHAELFNRHPAIYKSPFLDRDALSHSKRLNAKLALQEVHRT